MSSPNVITPHNDAEGCVKLAATDSCDLGIVVSDSASIRPTSRSRCGRGA